MEGGAALPRRRGGGGHKRGGGIRRGRLMHSCPPSHHSLPSTSLSHCFSHFPEMLTNINFSRGQFGKRKAGAAVEGEGTGFVQRSGKSGEGEEGGRGQVRRSRVGKREEGERWGILILHPATHTHPSLSIFQIMAD